MNRNLELLDPEIMGNEPRMYELLGYLRENDPVSYVEHPDYEAFWAVTRHEDIKNISRHNDRFLNNPRASSSPEKYRAGWRCRVGSGYFCGWAEVYACALPVLKWLP